MSIDALYRQITDCKRCPRLVEYIGDIAKNKTRRFKDDTYWGKPLSGFGDISAKIVIVGLAPAAHGGNRTGRMFTGDSSGDWLARVLHKYGFASIPTSHNIHDGFVLDGVYVTATIRCAPPQNKPTRYELDNCLPYLEQEFSILKNIKTVICLGQIAYCTVCRMCGLVPQKFGHNNLYRYNSIKILTSYHPSRQNTQTGRLVWRDWCAVFARAKRISM